METKTFNVVTSLSMVVTLTIAVLGIGGVAITGIYPGVLVLVLIAFIPIASKFYAKRMAGKSKDVHGNYYRALIVINVLCVLVVLWMTFVILHDRVLQDCC